MKQRNISIKLIRLLVCWLIILLNPVKRQLKDNFSGLSIKLEP